MDCIYKTRIKTRSLHRTPKALFSVMKKTFWSRKPKDCAGNSLLMWLKHYDKG